MDSVAMPMLAGTNKSLVHGEVIGAVYGASGDNWPTRFTAEA